MLEGGAGGGGVGEGEEEEAEPGAISPTARSERNGGITNSPAQELQGAVEPNALVQASSHCRPIRGNAGRREALAHCSHVMKSLSGGKVRLRRLWFVDTVL